MWLSSQGHAGRADSVRSHLAVQGVNDADVTNFLAASYGIMWPYNSAPVQATISELYIDPATSVARVQWSQGKAPRGTGSTVGIPPGLIGAGFVWQRAPQSVPDLQRGQLSL